ncbi:MAG: phage DNA packaging protein J [Akkermansiaceae bacterium]
MKHRSSVRPARPQPMD